MQFAGRSGTKVLFSNEESAAIVDESTNTVIVVDSLPLLSSFYPWSIRLDSPSDISQELATAALTELDISVFSDAQRMYTIPKSVQEEAKRAIEWRKEFKRGGTPVGSNTAKILAKGGQIGIKKIRHIAKYFPRHEVDKKGKGYKPGDDGYPSKGRIAWALWGGDAAQRWASANVERENKKETSTIVASYGYYDIEDPMSVDVTSFNFDDCRYMVRVRLDKSGLDRLYCIDPSGYVSVWDDGCWDTLGHIDHDINTYDKSLDDPYDTIEKTHIPIDQESAVRLAALFDSDPFMFRSVEEVSPEEHYIYEDAAPYMNLSNITAIVASDKFKTDRDGNYTPEERSDKATSQLRDKVGRFTETGAKVVIGGNSDYRGTIVSQNARSQSVKVELADGKFIDIPANQTQKEESFDGPPPAPEKEQNLIEPDVSDPIADSKNEAVEKADSVDFDGILSKSKVVPKDKIRIPKKIDPLSKESLQELLSDYPSWVSSQRKNKDDGVEILQQEDTKKGPDLFYEKDNFNWNENKNALTDSTLKNFVESPENQKNKNSLVSSVESSEKEYKNPRQSDVAPIYMAIVADDDPQAVMDLIALVPKGPSTTAPMTFKRDPGEWVADASIIQDLNSATPPPVIPLDNEMLESVIKQIDGPEIAAKKLMEQNKEKAVTASSVLSSNQFKVAKFHKYWISGRGSKSIKWRSNGDWSRCIQSLSKHMGPAAKEYCSLQFLSQNNSWPGDINLLEHKSQAVIASAGLLDNTSLPTSEDIVDYSKTMSQYNFAKEKVLLAGGSRDLLYSNGAEFFIPLVIPESIESGDGRIFEKDSITMRDLPLPLLWQIKTGEGHNGSVVVGKITRMERTEEGIGNAYGFFDLGAYGSEAERLVRGGFISGVSADLDRFEANEETTEDNSENPGEISNGRIKIKKARVMAVTIVPKPAFQECQIKILDSKKIQEEIVVPDGVYVDDIDDLEASSLVACGIVAGVIPTTPPVEWFDNPKLKKATPLTVDDDGRVFGHIAAWHVDHIGMSFGTRPPRSRSKYAYFHTGVVRTEEGNDVPVGQLTLAGGHASLEASAQEAVRHYDDTASSIADVHAGEDSYGIWVAGALRPGTSPEQVRALRASAPSGDWRPIKGQLELVAVCQVNVPGFPIARARVASGQVMALVAAGANTLARMKSDPVSDLKNRLARLEEKENAPLVAAMESARSKVLAVKAEELAAKMGKTKKEIEKDSDYMVYGIDDGNPEEELAVISRRVRKRLANEGKALPDGSFPIRNAYDLRNAIQSYGRASAGKKAKVRMHIIKRAKALKQKDLVPSTWKEASLIDPIDEIPKEGILAAADDPCWEGYVMIGMKTLDGKEVPNCVPKDSAVHEVDEEDDFPKAQRESNKESLTLSNDILRERIRIVESMVAAGGADRNRGNAEKLRRYWTKGVGAAKIRWGTPGDWTRCVKYLSKYMGVRAKGYCQLRHKEATGVYTGSKLNPGKRRGRNNSIFSAFSEAEFRTFESLYGDPENYNTEVLDTDMMLSLLEVMQKDDEFFSATWAPEKDIVDLIKDCGYSPSGSYTETLEKE